MSNTVVKIYTDGACKGNPGPGGWGVVMSKGARRKELYGGEQDTTSNRMELTAAIKGLEALTMTSIVEITTDSKYVKDGITKWIHNWKKNGWKNSMRKPVKNADLWCELDRLQSEHQVEWFWVKGHSGHPENERADCLANKGVLNID
jgi:ribonuclease HI